MFVTFNDFLLVIVLYRTTNEILLKKFNLSY